MTLAVPVDTVMRLVPQIIAKGRIATAGIGIKKSCWMGRRRRDKRDVPVSLIAIDER